MSLIKMEQRDYAYILADGKIRVQCDENTPGAVKREYETSDGKEGVKYEQVYDRVDGKITFIGFKEGDYGKQLHIEIDGLNLMMNVSSNFAEDLMKKLPNIDLSSHVTLTPYNFYNEKGKSVKGITVMQGDEKINNFFWNIDNGTPTNGYPLPEGDTKKFDSDDWKVYFTVVRKFLMKYIEENVIPQMAVDSLPFAEADNSEITTEEIPV